MSYVSKQYRLIQLASEAEQNYAAVRRANNLRGQTTPVRHKCFVSYHAADIDAVVDFVEAFNDVFIPRVVGVSESDHFGDPIDSKDEEYIKSAIGSKYLTDTTVTIVYVGACTWTRKYVDWEIASSLRQGKVNRRNGLMGITPRGAAYPLPARFNDNWSGDDMYARYYYYPTSAMALRNWIDDAYSARTTRADDIVNGRALRTRNESC